MPKDPHHDRRFLLGGARFAEVAGTLVLLHDRGGSAQERREVVEAVKVAGGCEGGRGAELQQCDDAAAQRGDGGHPETDHPVEQHPPLALELHFPPGEPLLLLRIELGEPIFRPDLAGRGRDRDAEHRAG